MDYQVLSQDEIQQIHLETLKILETVGIRVFSDEALELFRSAGADIIPEGKDGIVRLSPRLVEEALSLAPKSVIYHGRDKSKDVDTTSGRMGFSTFGECVKMIDPYTRELRPTSKEDCGHTGKIVDYFDELSLIMRAVCSIWTFC